MRDIEEAGGKALAIRADSANIEAVKQAVTETVNTLGRLDILVNNAGVATMAPIDQVSMEDFDRLIAVNVKGVFVATQEAIRHMGEGGRIIMIGSINSEFVPVAGLSIYALTKGAIASFTRGLARDLGSRGIAGLVSYLASPEAAFVTGASLKIDGGCTS